MNPSPYRRTDLAIEESALSHACPGVLCEEEECDGITVTTVTVSDREGEKALNRPMGQYVTLSFSRFWEEYEQETEEVLKKALSEKLASLLPADPPPERILVVGLGNRAVTADAIGPFAAERIEVTGHLQAEEALAPYLPHCLLYAIAPGVVGKTGIETLEQVKGALKASGATHVIAIDALAALNVDRLGRTVQLTDTGLVPGSGVGNHRAALNQETLGVPVIAVGVPLVVSSSTLVWDALEKAQIHSPNEALHQILENGKSFFVTLKDCDLACDLLATVVADAINLCAENMT